MLWIVYIEILLNKGAHFMGAAAWDVNATVGWFSYRSVLRIEVGHLLANTCRKYQRKSHSLNMENHVLTLGKEQSK